VTDSNSETRVVSFLCDAAGSLVETRSALVDVIIITIPVATTEAIVRTTTMVVRIIHKILVTIVALDIAITI
jgi:hypothetical protein